MVMPVSVGEVNDESANVGDTELTDVSVGDVRDTSTTSMWSGITSAISMALEPVIAYDPGSAETNLPATSNVLAEPVTA